jgi:hypothetical protein
MCRSTHLLAAMGTMSWPHSGAQRPPRRLRPAFLVQLRNHLLAEAASLEASVGRAHRKLLRFQLTVTHRVMNRHARRRSEVRRQREKPRICTTI